MGGVSLRFVFGPSARVPPADIASLFALELVDWLRPADSLRGDLFAYLFGGEERVRADSVGIDLDLPDAGGASTLHSRYLGHAAPIFVADVFERQRRGRALTPREEVLAAHLFRPSESTGELLARQPPGLVELRGQLWAIDPGGDRVSAEVLESGALTAAEREQVAAPTCNCPVCRRFAP